MDVTESITVLESDARQIFRDIRKLKDMFKVRIWVRKDETNPGYSVIESTGTEVNTKQAIDYINANLPRTLSMNIHPNDIGWIIGKSGDNIRSLKSLYHINAWFEQNTLHLRGRLADIEKAKESVKKHIQGKLLVHENKGRNSTISKENESESNNKGKKKYTQLQKDARIKMKEFKQLKNSLKKDY